MKYIHIFLGISILFSSVFECNYFEAFCGDFEIFVILSATLLPIKSPVAYVPLKNAFM